MSQALEPFRKWDAAYRRAFVDRLVREYIANEIQRELAVHEGATMAVRALGEVLANMPGFSEDVCVVAAEVTRELLQPTKEK
jgi:hypothetical protein